MKSAHVWYVCIVYYVHVIGVYGGFPKWWYPTTMGFPTKNDHFGVFWGYHHLRKHPYIYIYVQVHNMWTFPKLFLSGTVSPNRPPKGASVSPVIRDNARGSPGPPEFCPWHVSSDQWIAGDFSWCLNHPFEK